MSVTYLDGKHYKEALRAVRDQRLEKERNYGRASVKDNMSAKDRDKLGALFHTWCDAFGTAHQDPITGDVEYHFATLGGLFRTNYDPNFGSLFGRFEHPDRVLRLNPNPHSGKWNTHTSRGDLPQSIFDYWSRQLQSVLV